MNQNADATEAAELVVSGSVVEQLTRGEVDMQVATAKRWPRSIQRFKQEAMAMAVKNPAVAKDCFYVVPRGGEKIPGPSIRLAEIVSSCWGNMRCEARVISIDDTMLTAQGTAWDMQNNVLMRREVKRRITGRNGKRFGDDMIVMTGNAACSIALRNAIFSVVPRSYVDDICEHCKRVAAGDRGSLDAAKAHWLKEYGDKGVTKQEVLDLLGRPGQEDITIDDIATLQGLWTALSEGETTLEELFGSEQQRQQATQDGVHKFGFKARQEAKQASETQAQEEPRSYEPPPRRTNGHRNGAENGKPEAKK